MNRDTIAAIATPPGVGGIATLRLSGGQALEIAQRHLSAPLTPRRATYCRFDNLDDVVATFFPAGYTGEPTVEITLHGSLYIQQEALATLTADGARLATPGEFTQRAFLNGRLDLSQAEAVADLIDAVTPAQHRLAVSQLRGAYAETLRQMHSQLLDLAALLELELDFSQEDVTFADRNKLMQLIEALRHQALSLIDSFEAGNAIRRGVPVAIVGAPNVGKSTLLNTLLGDDRAIVSATPGTTRDTIEETFTIGGTLFRLIDTAGLRSTSDVIEQEGIARTLRAIQQAHIVLEVTAPDAETAAADTSSAPVLIRIVNKCDLPGQPSPRQKQVVDGVTTLFLSAKNGDGIDLLRQEILSASRRQAPDSVLLTNVRHRDALISMIKALDNTAEGLANGTPTDLVAVDLRQALYHLGTITGHVTSDNILTNIFSRFCVGK